MPEWCLIEWDWYGNQNLCTVLNLAPKHCLVWILFPAHTDPLPWSHPQTPHTKGNIACLTLDPCNWRNSSGRQSQHQHLTGFSLSCIWTFVILPHRGVTGYTHPGFLPMIILLSMFMGSYGMSKKSYFWIICCFEYQSLFSVQLDLNRH